ncbi:MAG: type II toxin-antitoxin system VapC family toxin [Lentisphaerae bacterium]|nr:type II toxin-antitoxin system VapC family toxin [Lentisphaerota bacterium]
MASEIFADTSGFYALLVNEDGAHEKAADTLRAAAGKRGFVTTDYVLDETATLLKARRHKEVLKPFFDVVMNSAACRIVWVSPGLFSAAHSFFLKHGDQDYSFTDCISFLVMHEHRIKAALTKDKHFQQAGFEVLL